MRFSTPPSQFWCSSYFSMSNQGRSRNLLRQSYSGFILSDSEGREESEFSQGTMSGYRWDRANESGWSLPPPFYPSNYGLRPSSSTPFYPSFEQFQQSQQFSNYVRYPSPQMHPSPNYSQHDRMSQPALSGPAPAFYGGRPQGVHRQRPDDYRSWVASKSKPPARSERFRLVSYNILADYLARDHRSQLYFHIPTRIMDWEWRKRRILIELQLWSPDILCLQEVDRFPELEKDLSTKGFRGIWKMRTGTATDGCAVFWRADRFHLQHEEYIEFNKLGLRDNIAQICVLESRAQRQVNSESTTSSGSQDRSLEYNQVVVCNIHVLFNPKRGEIKLGQVRVLLERAHAVSVQWNNAPVVLCGDFNSTPKSPLYNFLSDQMLNLQGLSKEQVSGQFSAYTQAPIFYPNYSFKKFNPQQWSNDLKRGFSIETEIHDKRLVNIFPRNKMESAEASNRLNNEIQEDIVQQSSDTSVSCKQDTSFDNIKFINHSFGNDIDAGTIRSSIESSHSISSDSNMCKSNEIQRGQSNSYDLKPLVKVNSGKSSSLSVSESYSHLEESNKVKVEVITENSFVGVPSETTENGEEMNNTLFLGSEFNSVSCHENNDPNFLEELHGADDLIKPTEENENFCLDFHNSASFNPGYQGKNVYDPYTWTTDDISIASGTEDCASLKHKLKLKSVYTEVEDCSGTRDYSGEPEVTSYNRKFMGTVDYIWSSEGLQTVKVLDTIHKDVLKRTPGFPTPKWGSDHLALACELAFTGSRTE